MAVVEKKLEDVVKSYTPPAPGTNTKKKNNDQQSHTRPTTQPCESVLDNLLDVLPFRDTDISDKEEYKPYIVTTYLPDGTFHQMKRACQKAGIALVTRPGAKLRRFVQRQ